MKLKSSLFVEGWRQIYTYHDMLLHILIIKQAGNFSLSEISQSQVWSEAKVALIKLLGISFL